VEGRHDGGGVPSFSRSCLRSDPPRDRDRLGSRLKFAVRGMIAVRGPASEASPGRRAMGEEASSARVTSLQFDP